MAADFIAGCVGGCAGVLVGHPFDTVKVRLQCQAGESVYRGTYHCLRTIIKEESARGLLKGISSPLVGLSLINAIVFGVQGSIQRQMTNPHTLTSHFISGATAGLVQSIVTCPMELVKTRMQVQASSHSCTDMFRTVYRSTPHCIKSIYRTEGVPGFYRGMLLTLMREAPGFGVYFMAYEYLCRVLGKGYRDEDISVTGILLAGGLAGVISWIPCYPIDVLKSRMQIDGVHSVKYNSIIDCIRQSYAKDGSFVFFRGMAPALVRAFPVNAVTFAVFSLTMNLLRRGQKQSEWPEWETRESRWWFIHETIPDVIEGAIHI